MAAVDLLGMEPDVPLVGVLCGQAVILPVVASHEDTQSRGGAELPGLGGALEAGLLFAPSPQVAAVRQLRADIVEVLFRFGLRQLLQNALQILQLLPAPLQLGGQVLLRRLGLGVLLKVPGGILLRRQPDIQRDIHIGAVFVVVVLGGEAALPPLHAVEIGGDQLAADPQVISVLTGGQLLLLRRQLAAHTVAGGGGGLQQIPPLLLHPLRLLPLFVEVVQQVGKAVIDLRLGVGAILGNRAVGKVRQRPVPFDKRRCKGVFTHRLLPPGEHIPQGVPLRCGGVCAAAGADCQLPRHQRGYGGEGVQQPAIQRRIRRGALQQGGKLLLRHGQRRALILPGGQTVKKPRQHLPVLLRLQIHAAQTVDDAAVPVAEDEIGAAGHPLPHQRKAAALPHLVGGQHGQRHHTLQRLLPDGLDDAAGQVLAQEHTEHRRLGRVVPQLLRQVDAGLVGPGVEEQAAAAPQQEDDLIPGGLLYFFDAAAGELGGKLPHHALQTDSV